MQRKLTRTKQTEEEQIKEAGLILDYDEIARKGSMSKEEGLVSKWYGIYGSRQPGDHMARVVNPGGKLSSAQIRVLAALGEKVSPGLVSFTTRQSVQFHKIQIADIPVLMRDLAGVGLTTFHGCGDVNRNVAACPWASECQYRRFDVRETTEATNKLIADSRDLDNLPRKFKITFSGCSGACAQPFINCCNGIAVLRKKPDGTTEEGYRVVIGGGMGWKPFVAQDVYSFVPKAVMPQVARAVAILFREQGDRTHRRFARLKWAVARLGIEKCRKHLADIFKREGVDASNFLTEPIEDVGKEVPDRPLLDPDPRDDEGLAIQRIMVPKGEITSEDLLRIAELSELYGDKFVYSTNRQNLELHGVDPAKIPELKAEIEKLGLRAEGFFGLQDVVSCVGTKYCPLAVSYTHGMFDRLQDIVQDERFALIREKVVINITGCPNSCSPYYIADIGLRGLRIRRDVGSIEGYQIRIGGTQERFGEVLGEYMGYDCVRVVRTVLETFLTYVQDTHFTGTLADHVHTEGIGLYTTAVAKLGIDYTVGQAPNPQEFSADTGEGQAAKDFKNIAKDVPCQEACPAKTNIPEYIRLIAEGDPDGAHLINQECNVLSGVLGRICTRPCEDDCRHQWTNTRGPVRICHLKRSAADGKSKLSQALPNYFNSSGKRVAVVGGGPAGLAAGRELKRYGHEVVLFERETVLGGQARTGVPQFRLPVDVIEEDIQAILDQGLEVQREKTVDTDGLTQALKDYDAVLLATGANRPRPLKLEGLEPGVAYEGLHFMRCYNLSEALDVTGDVIVIGGGFTAVDCARSARRLGGPDIKVTIMYRRSTAQMAANEAELHELRAEGIEIETLVSPVRASVKEGVVQSVTFQRNILGEPDPDGRPSFVAVPDSELTRTCRTLIFAIGQTPETDILPAGVSVKEHHRTTEPKLFVAGDFSMGNGDVISAVADGKSAADAMDTFLIGECRREKILAIDERDDIDRTRDDDLLDSPEMPVSDLTQRDLTTEVELGLTPELTDTHAWRCYLCNHKFEIDQDKCIHCDWCIKAMPRQCIMRLSHLQLDENGCAVEWTEVEPNEPDKATYIWINSDECIRCGRCRAACPVDAISLRKADITHRNCNDSCS